MDCAVSIPKVAVFQNKYFCDSEHSCFLTAAAELAEHLAQLPLPDDYELQELRTLTRMYMKELIQS